MHQILVDIFVWTEEVDKKRRPWPRLFFLLYQDISECMTTHRTSFYLKQTTCRAEGTKVLPKRTNSGVNGWTVSSPCSSLNVFVAASCMNNIKLFINMTWSDDI